MLCLAVARAVTAKVLGSSVLPALLPFLAPPAGAAPALDDAVELTPPQLALALALQARGDLPETKQLAAHVVQARQNLNRRILKINTPNRFVFR